MRESILTLVRFMILVVLLLLSDLLSYLVATSYLAQLINTSILFTLPLVTTCNQRAELFCNIVYSRFAFVGDQQQAASRAPVRSCEEEAPEKKKNICGQIFALVEPLCRQQNET